MPMHALQDLPFTSVIPERGGAMPDIASLRRQVALVALAHCELTEQVLGMYAPPGNVREVQLTRAAFDQIRCMWHDQRPDGSSASPTIPLKLFVTGFGQDSSGNTWVDIEVHPGLADWEQWS